MYRLKWESPENVGTKIYFSPFFNPLTSIYSESTFSIYSNSLSITASPLTPLIHLYQHAIISNFCLFFLLLRPLTCVHSSQATPKPAQSERKKKESQPETSTPRRIRSWRRHQFENPTSAQVV